ncbi:hypothetical protein D3C73_681430 [compost metagenome]
MEYKTAACHTKRSFSFYKKRIKERHTVIPIYLLLSSKYIELPTDKDHVLSFIGHRIINNSRFCLGIYNDLLLCADTHLLDHPANDDHHLTFVFSICIFFFEEVVELLLRVE